MPAYWEDCFRKGVEAFHALNYQFALSLFDAAIARGGDCYKVYDSRAAVYEKIGRMKNALKDSRKVIELAPHMRHGYTRSARIFLLLRRHDSAFEMVKLALERIRASDAVHRLELEDLRRVILKAKEAQPAEEARKRSTVLTLPVELISEICIFATELDSTASVRVSLVCTHWRAISLSTPTLWSCLVLSAIRPVLKMELWQERSKERITELQVCGSISWLQLREALAKCGPAFCKRLKYLRSEVHLPELWSCLAHAPHFLDLDLEEISVFRPDGNHLTHSPTPALFPSSSRTSSTRSLSIEYADVDWAQAVPQLAHLRNLIIRSLDKLPSTLLIQKLFEANPCLEDIILETVTPWELDGAITNQRIELSRLSHLQLLGPMDASLILSRLSLPNLKRFVISQCLRTADRAIYALDPPFPALTELSIRKCSFSEDHIVLFLQHMSTLNKLEVTYSGSDLDVVVDAIACSHDDMHEESRFICPALQYVNFSYCPHLNGGPIVRLVKLRIAAANSSSSFSTRIKEVIIDGCPKVDPAVPEWLRSRVETFSCVYMKKEDIRKMNRRQRIYH